VTEDEEEAEIAARNAAIEETNNELMKAYQLTFNSPSGQLVLIDLMSFCKFRVPIEDRTDEGKRQVALRIINLTQLSTEQLYAAYRGKVLPSPL
jgi:hypothetical protein